MVNEGECKCDTSEQRDAQWVLRQVRCMIDGAAWLAWLNDGDRACNDVDERIAFVWLTWREFHVSRLTGHATHMHAAPIC